MEVDKEVQFLGLEEKRISKGEKAGQVFFIVKFICLNDAFEVTIFDNPSLVAKFMNLTRFQDFIGTFKITQNNGNVKLNLVSITV